MTLDDFETLVLHQLPASTPWAPVTDYSFSARQAIEGDHPRLILEVLEPRSILDVGCGHGHLVRMLKNDAPDLSVIGIDKSISPSLCDVADPSMWHFWPRVDLVICREVLEHLTVREVRVAVTNLCRLSERLVYVTTRFHPHPTSLLDVSTSDDLDPTHITMLNKSLLRLLFILEGFRRRPDLEEQMDWKKLCRVLVYERV